MINRKGFTLVAIIGLLSTLAVVSLGSAREKARDARRISDIRQMQTALELYFADQGVYPVEATAITVGVDNTTDILTENGFENQSSPTGSEVYMGQVPGNFPQPASIADYVYQSADGTTYTLTFEIEGTVSGLSGALTATPSGIQ